MQRQMTKYPIGIQNFESLRIDDYKYVDKTAYVYEMASTGRYYFLSRPRRFGKSLLLSTIEAYFEGKRELFKGLAIEKLENEWKQYPILHIDLNAERYTDEQALTSMLHRHLTDWEHTYGHDNSEGSVSQRFAGVIRRAYEKTGLRVVILVDEYDKPMVTSLGNEQLQENLRDILKAFYGVLKSCDRYIRFAMLTGVTKFSKVSVFSDLNNLRDISMTESYTAVCGLTEQEIRDNMDGGVALLAQKCGISKEECYAKLRTNYDGYHFRQNTTGVYNPFSVINTMASQAFGDYWFETGTPTLLVTMLQTGGFSLDNMLAGEVSTQMLGSIETMRDNPLPLLFQSGYLTIKDYNEEFDSYTLGFPNKEVENGFIKFLLPLYSNAETTDSRFAIQTFIREIRDGQPEAFMKRLSAMMADTDYRIVGNSELYFQNFCFLFFRLLGLYVEVERATSDGRADITITTRQYIYIIEMKLDGSAGEALSQIERKRYAAPFAANTQTTYNIGVNFSTKSRTITEWKISQGN